MIYDNQIEDYMKNQTENLTPPEPEYFENEPEILRCSSCGDDVIDFTVHKFYVICNDCQKEQSHRSLDQIVDAIKYRQRSMSSTMNSIGKLSISVLNPYK